MTLQTLAALKNLFETGDVPTGANFSDLIDSTARARNVVPVEYFGAVAVDWGGTPTDNLAALQSAVDWSAATGGVALLGYGVYGIDGTLNLKSYTSLVGAGGTTEASCIRQLNTAWPDVLASDDSISSTTGAACVRLQGFVIDGGWDLKATAGVGSIWTYTFASKTQRGLFLSCPTAGAQSLNRTNSPDTNHKLNDLMVRRVAGTGIWIEGRGEVQASHLRIEDCAVDGMNMQAPDNFMHDVSIHVIGNRGLAVTGGSQVINNVKCWWIGMNKGEEPLGVGAELATGAGSGNIDAVNLTTQDTYGPGMKIWGIANRIHGRVNRAGGGLLQNIGNGWPGTRALSRACIEMRHARDCHVQLAVYGEDLGLAAQGVNALPYLVSWRDSGADQNLVQINYYKHQSPTSFLHTTLIEAVGGLVTNNRHNVVRTQNGDVLYGRPTAANLANAAHSVNVYKRTGQMVTMDTGQLAISAGDTAAATWVNALGALLATPV